MLDGSTQWAEGVWSSHSCTLIITFNFQTLKGWNYFVAVRALEDWREELESNKIRNYDHDFELAFSFILSRSLSACFSHPPETHFIHSLHLYLLFFFSIFCPLTSSSSTLSPTPPSTLCEVDDDGKIESADGAENNHSDSDSSTRWAERDEWIEEIWFLQLSMLVGGFHFRSAQRWSFFEEEEKGKISCKEIRCKCFPFWHESGISSRRLDIFNMSASKVLLSTAAVWGRRRKHESRWDWLQWGERRSSFSCNI